VEVELENEKRSAQKARTTSERSESNDKHLQEVQQELQKEVEERRRIQLEAEEAAEQFEQRKSGLESRLDAFRMKLTKTKEQLADAQKHLKDKSTKNTTVRVKLPEPEPELESELESEPEPEPELELELELEQEPEPTPKPKPKPLPKKRSFAEVGLDASLGTPGDLPPAKRGKRAGSVQPGAKSSFSITPFLNRTGSVAPDSPGSSPSKPTNSGGTGVSSTSTTEVPLAAGPRAQAKPAPSRPKSLGTAPAARGNAQPQAKRAAKSLSAPKLDQVPEEDEDVAEDVQSKPVGPPPSRAAAPDRPSELPFAKKKRIFLGKTIFDDDDEATSRPQPVGIFSNKIALGNIGKTQPKPPNLGAVGRSVPTFGGFSPLKKDRKLAKA
jgi:hypothetical protein